MKVVITGGAGYIGSTISSACADHGIGAVIVDNLATSPVSHSACPRYVADVADPAVWAKVFADHPDITAVIHCAALTVAPDSVTNPLSYYEANVASTVRMLTHLATHGCRRVLFASTVAVDGQAPNAYAAGKAMVETILADCATAGMFGALVLRYANPIGADPSMRSGPHLHGPNRHALQLILAAADRGTKFTLSADWPTRDGTPIRDYIHVWDVALAHVAALHRLDEIAPVGTVETVSLGTGTGTTVRELIATVEAVTGRHVPTAIGPRRPGDHVGGHINWSAAQELLGWTPKLGVEDAVRHEVEWRRLNGVCQ